VKRREFISLLGGALSWPLVVRPANGEGDWISQQPVAGRSAGVVASFREGLREQASSKDRI
jgi:hypothetical protein